MAPGSKARPRVKSMAKNELTLHLAQVPDEVEEQVQTILDMGEAMSGRKPTEAEIAEVRKILGAPEEEAPKPWQTGASPEAN
jgi:hypothetical protein